MRVYKCSRACDASRPWWCVNRWWMRECAHVKQTIISRGYDVVTFSHRKPHTQRHQRINEGMLCMMCVRCFLSSASCLVRYNNVCDVRLSFWASHHYTRFVCAEICWMPHSVSASSLRVFVCVWTALLSMRWHTMYYSMLHYVVVGVNVI